MIGVQFLRPAWLALLVLVPLAVLAWRRWPPPLPRGRSQAVLASRIFLIALLVVALAGPRLTTQPNKRAVVAVVDLSASVKEGSGLDQEAALVRELESAKGPDDLFGVVTFGHDAAVELPPTRDPSFESFQTQPDPSYTDIAGALRLAAGLIPDGYARQLVLISDGRQNLDAAASAAAALRAQGVRVDVVPVGKAPNPEVMVTSVDAPSQLHEGETASVAVHLQATRREAGKLTLIVDGRELTTRDVTLPAGSSSQTFDVPGLRVGLHRVQAELAGVADTYPENNVGEAAVRVTGRPQVLVLEGKAGEGQNVAQALHAAGMNVDERQAVSAPTDTSTLGDYDSTVIVDAPADAFPSDAMSAIARSVHDLGKGLVTVGGSTSYGPGGWQGTALEQALPVQMEIPKRKDQPKVAVVLVMETMEDPRADQVAIGAAESLIDKLTPQDQVAVTDGNTGFLVPMTPVTDKKAIDAKLENGNLGDPPSYLPFLQMAVSSLTKTDAPLKHIVVLGDGDAIEAQPQVVQNFLQDALAKGITTSSIGVDVHGQSQFMAYMQDIARWGGGRFYQSNNPSQVPDLFLKESLTSLRPWFEQTPFEPKIAASGDLLQGVPTDAFPQLGGYVVTTAKPTAEQYLISPKQDPVLASWSYGLGRTAAWTSDSGGLWTGDFLRSPVSASVFAHMVQWTLPTSGSQQLSISAQPSGDGLAVTVTGPQAAGGRVQVGVVRPNLESSSVDLTAVGPGRWQGRIDQASVGIYLLHGVLSQGGQARAQGDAAVSVPYSPEYLELGRDQGTLRAIARSGAGALLSAPAQAWAQRPLPAPVSTDVFWPLLLLAGLLWPLDVAARRISLRPRQVARNIVTYVRERRAEDLELAVPDELLRLRARIERLRRPMPRAGPDSPAEGGAGPGSVPGAEPRAGPSAAGAAEAPPSAGQPARRWAPPRPAGPEAAAPEPAAPEAPAPQAPEPVAARSEPRREPPTSAEREEERLSARLLEARRRRRGQSR